MSGRLRFSEGAGEPRVLHDHVVAYFREGGALVFHDPRRFGLCVVDDPQTSKLVASMGPEPLDESAYHHEYLSSWRRATARTVKDVLMDQRVVAGLGNIYVNEILFRARVRPRRRMPKTSIDECARIVEATRTVIEEAIEQGGSTISDFLDGIGRRGGYQGSHLVYDREGKACFVCGTPIKAVVVGQRSSFYCPACQK
jgi:formamidopyrimidine-DNA glycosylase